MDNHAKAKLPCILYSINIVDAKVVENLNLVVANINEQGCKIVLARSYHSYDEQWILSIKSSIGNV